jgi:hypothetical protein
MGQLTEQYIRARAKPFIVEVDQQTEQKMSVCDDFNSFVFIISYIFLASQSQLLN